MTTPTITKGKAAVAQTKAAESAVAPATESVAKPINRREFLYYIWGASIALLLAQSGGAIIWFLFPRFREGEFGGVFRVDPATLPAVGAAPVSNPSGKYWLSHTEQGVVALSMVCTHLGCLFKWVDANNRFECPCHGSKFTTDGTYIEGPAPRSLDRFVMNVITPSGTVSTDSAGNPIKVDGATQLEINTGRKIKGKGIGA
jgi:cytochrome b6-f complex iron-sulfur subunit